MEIKYFRFFKKNKFIGFLINKNNRYGKKIELLKNRGFSVNEVSLDEYEEAVYKYYVIFKADTGEIFHFVKSTINDSDHFKMRYIFKSSMAFKLISKKDYEAHRKNYLEKEIVFMDIKKPNGKTIKIEKAKVKKRKTLMELCL